MSVRSFVIVCLSLLALHAHQAQAAVIWDNGTFSPSTGGDITNSAWADDFQFSQSQTFDVLRFWACTPGGDQTFSSFSGTVGWAIHQDVGGGVGPVVFSGIGSPTLTNTGVNRTFDGGSRIFQLDVPLGSVTLPAGTYWWHFRENAIFSPTDNTPIQILGTGTGGMLGGLRIDANEVSPTFPTQANVDLAFQLIPEPAGIALLAMATPLLLARRGGRLRGAGR